VTPDHPDISVTVGGRYQADVDGIVSHRHDLGDDCWTTPDRRLAKGAPFSAVESVGYLLELGVDPAEPLVARTIGLILDSWRPDGHFHLYPGGSGLPCQTTKALGTLCHAGLTEHSRVRSALDHLLESQWLDSGWRCTSFPYGHGPETEHSNPHPTLMALDAFRHTSCLNHEPKLDRAVGFLLDHWETRVPTGPCHYGIGTLFMQAEYPFRTYNLFHWVHVLSFYERAKADPRFHEAFDALTAKLADGQMVVERVVPKLAKLNFCAKGKPSDLATRRYREIVANLGG
jgi:hypothetical protein